MLAIELYKQLESHITEENKEIIKAYFDLTRQDLNKKKLNFFSGTISLKELNEHFDNKFEAGHHYDTVFIKNGSFNIGFFQSDHVSEKKPHMLLEEVKNGTTYRTILTDDFTKTSSLKKDSSAGFTGFTGFKEQIGFSNYNRENINVENVNRFLNLNIGDFVIDLLYAKDKSYTNKEICDLVSISIPENKASPELVEIFVEHQSKFRDVINNKIENKLQQKPTI